MRIFVSTHKPVIIPWLNDTEHESYEVFDCRQDAKNWCYSEMSAYRYIRESVQEDIVGVTHYHRFLAEEDHVTALKDLKIKDILREYDIIVPEITCLEESVKENYAGNHYVPDWNDMVDTVNRLHPGFDVQKQGNVRGLYRCNMMICRQGLFNEYCDWLFPVIDEMFKRNHARYRSYSWPQYRTIGYITERIFSMWVREKCLKKYESFCLEEAYDKYAI